ncbi:MAG: Bro-N domain-containing protein [Candidatus Aenigmarchaeota archaeon]|nr:Bro-N domain-containing protein [Candidatus Aenigmarchaeota archaeon]
MESNNALIVFEDKKIRRTYHNNEWYFSVVDVVSVLTDSSDSKQYIKKVRKRDSELDLNWGTICTLLEMIAYDGKKRKVNCANTEGIFRIIQSIPSPKAEPFKRWLAKVGYDRVKEIQDPELAQKRMKEIYKQKGYSDNWVEKRVRGIAIRDELTDEWDSRGIERGKEYSILTAEISKATFGMTPNEYKNYKGLKKENLRDHMTDLELIFTMLGEASTTKIARGKEAIGFIENRNAAKEGGEIAGDARKKLEIKSKEKISTPENYLEKPESVKRLERNEEK